MDASKRNSQSNLALSFVQDNISSFFGNQNGNGNGNDSSDSLVPQASATSKKSSNDSASINSQEVRTPTTTMTSSFSSFKQKQQSQLTDIFVEKLLAMALPPNTELGANVIEGRVKNNPVLANGPDLKNPNIPTPASEFSKEFLLNLTDLQNHMVLYVYGWDVVVHLLSKFAYFTDEAVSPFYFLSLLIIGLVSVSFGDLIFPLIPIKFILITTGWAATVVFHPYFYDYVFNMVYSEETRYYILGKTNKVEDILHKHFDLEEPPEQKEVEIFEIHQFNKSAKEWHLVFFLNDDFTKISPSRLSYDEHSPIGSLNKSSIKPPKDWEFITDEDWKIDLYPDSWVKSHLLEGVVRIDIETKWVYDLADDDNGYQPQFRRRRWTRVVTRHSDILDGKSAVTTPKKKRTGSGGSIEEH
ncbi:Peroxisomal membrane protein PEX29 [Cyberlindnera fabianii]|uniref:Peroxisomal membrane protein PEX29 n=1 Tax=Cyberlindnera fabianii TaxID=36022 RepID=A0A1V2LC27_CYBFA|nr:Peroxisomal membrane protein PEX29 [Cyberlindnera fabianii]